MNAARWASEIPRCASRWGAYECSQSEGHGGYHETEGGFTRWADGAATGPAQKKAPTHPAPSTMARDATPEEWAALADEGRGHHAFFRAGMVAGVAAERARYAAALRADGCAMRADDLEGKVSA